MLTRKNFKVRELKASGNDGAFSGILSTYGNVDLVGDVCDKGCFDGTVASKGTKYPMLWNHNDNEPIGSFNVVSTDENLAVAGKFNLGVKRAAEIYELLKAGDIDGMSIGYVPTEWYYDADGTRHLKAVELYEGSITPFPANPLARAEAKRMDEIGMVKKGMARQLQLKKYTKEQIDEILEVLSKAFEEGMAEPEKKPDEESTEEEKPDEEKRKKECESEDEETKSEEEEDKDPKESEPEAKSMFTPAERKNMADAIQALRAIHEE